MIIDIESISENLSKIEENIKKLQQDTLGVPTMPKSVDDEVEYELEEPHYKHQVEDTKFDTKYRYIK